MHDLTLTDGVITLSPLNLDDVDDHLVGEDPIDYEHDYWAGLTERLAAQEGLHSWRGSRFGGRLVAGRLWTAQHEEAWSTRPHVL